MKGKRRRSCESKWMKANLGLRAQVDSSLISTRNQGEGEENQCVEEKGVEFDMVRQAVSCRLQLERVRKKSERSDKKDSQEAQKDRKKAWNQQVNIQVGRGNEIQKKKHEDRADQKERWSGRNIYKGTYRKRIENITVYQGEIYQKRRDDPFKPQPRKTKLAARKKHSFTPHLFHPKHVEQCRLERALRTFLIKQRKRRRMAEQQELATEDPNTTRDTFIFWKKSLYSSMLILVLIYIKNIRTL